MVQKPRTFENFPKGKLCPVCHTDDEGECILVAIDGTDEDNICEAAPTHLWCAVAKRYNKEMGLIYTKL